MANSKAESDYMSAVASLGCIACRKMGYEGTPAEIHHIGNRTMGKRSSNYDTIPLCPIHHRTGPDAVHMNKKVFEAQFGTELELLKETVELLKIWRDSFV